MKDANTKEYILYDSSDFKEQQQKKRTKMQDERMLLLVKIVINLEG